MARVHFVKEARKDYPEIEVKKGESYYWWQFRFGPKRKSKTAPRRAQLTQSGFLSQLYDIEDGLPGRFTGLDIDDVLGEIDNLVSEIEDMKGDCESALENMPDNLRESSNSGITLQERIDGLDNWISELQSADTDYDKDSMVEEIKTDHPELTEESEKFQEFLKEKIEERRVEIVDEILSFGASL